MDDNMKDQKIGPLPIPVFVLVGGLAGFFLRLQMLAVGYDSQGVQITGSWPYVSLWVLSGLVLIGLAVLCLGMGKRSGLEENFKAAKIPAVCAVLSAAGLFVYSIVNLLNHTDLFSIVVYVLGVGAAFALAFQGYLRVSGRASAPAGMLVCLYLAALLICRFRTGARTRSWAITALSFWPVSSRCWRHTSWQDFPWAGGAAGRLFFAPWRLCISAAFPWQTQDGRIGCSLPPWLCGSSPGYAP